MTNYKGAMNTIYLLPIRKLTFDLQHSSDNDLSIEEIEAESSYNVSTIDRTDDKGTNRILAYKVDATIYVPHNYYHTNGLIPNLMRFSNRPHVVDPSDQDHFHINILSGGTVINSTGSQSIMLCNYNGNVGLSWKIESVEFRPRLIISINAIFKDYSYLFGS